MRGEVYAHVILQVYGKHNIFNALAAAAAAASASAFLSEAEGVAKATAGEKRMAVPKMAALPPTNARLLSKV